MTTTSPLDTGDPRGPEAPRRPAVTGIFDDRRAATRAVRRLAEKSVPADSIEVHVLDTSENPTREVTVEDESGALRGARIGAMIGAVVGLLIVVVVASGMLGEVGLDPLGLRSLSGAIGAIAAGALSGVPLGALIGMGHWQGSKKISVEESERGAIRVRVISAELQEVSRQVMEAVGAREIRSTTE